MGRVASKNNTGCQTNGCVQNIGIQEFQNEKYRSFIGNILENIGEICDERMDVDAQERGKKMLRDVGLSSKKRFRK